MNWFKKLFSKEVKSPSLLSFSVEKATDPDSTQEHFIAGVAVKNGQEFLDFLRNSDYDIDVSQHSDQELAHLFVYQYSQRWLSENLKAPLFVETHGFKTHGEIKYDRIWNNAFIGSITNIGFEQLPPTEGELVEMYMNFVYGTRMMEEMEAAEAANPQSFAHPELTNPDNKFKG